MMDFPILDSVEPSLIPALFPGEYRNKDKYEELGIEIDWGILETRIGGEMGAPNRDRMANWNTNTDWVTWYTNAYNTTDTNIHYYPRPTGGTNQPTIYGTDMAGVRYHDDPNSWVHDGADAPRNVQRFRNVWSNVLVWVADEVCVRMANVANIQILLQVCFSRGPVTTPYRVESVYDGHRTIPLPSPVIIEGYRVVLA